MTRSFEPRRTTRLRPSRSSADSCVTVPAACSTARGETAVLVTASLSDTVPPFLEGKSIGWLTAEYAMLPGSTSSRIRRGTDGRATEIQRLIGRSLRAVVDRKAFGPWTIHIDADVLNADGGTRTAAITAAFIAVADAVAAVSAPRLAARFSPTASRPSARASSRASRSSTSTTAKTRPPRSISTSSG